MDRCDDAENTTPGYQKLLWQSMTDAQKYGRERCAVVVGEKSECQ